MREPEEIARLVHELHAACWEPGVDTKTLHLVVDEMIRAVRFDRTQWKYQAYLMWQQERDCTWLDVMAAFEDQSGIDHTHRGAQKRFRALIAKFVEREGLPPLIKHNL